MTKCPTEAEKIGFAKAHDKLIIDFGRQKRNQIQQHITANIWENNKNLKRGTHVKINPKTRNRVISSPRDENITALRKEYESRKSKRRKNKPIILRSVVFQLYYISDHFGSFPSGFVVANKTEKNMWTKRINYINKASGGCRKLNMQKPACKWLFTFKN